MSITALHTEDDDGAFVRVPEIVVDPRIDMDLLEVQVDRDTALQERRAHHDRLRSLIDNAPTKCHVCGASFARRHMTNVAYAWEPAAWVCVPCLYPHGGGD